jgi:Flp pilus assembly protein TadD
MSRLLPRVALASGLAFSLLLPSFIARTACCQTSQPPAWEAKALALIQAGRFAEAVELLTPVKRRNPKDPRPYFYSGLAFMESGDLAQAASELDEAVRLDPGKIEYLLFKANVSSRLGHKDLALRTLAVFSDTSKVNGLTHAWMWLLADSYYRCHQPDDALRVLAVLAKRTPADSRVDLNRGQSYLLKGDQEQARQCFKASLQKNSKNNPVAYYELGKLLHQLSEIPAAKQALSSAVRQDPNNPEYAYKLATVCLALNQDAEALRYLQPVESSGSKHPEIYYALARAYRKVGKEAEAESALKKFQETNNKAKKQADQDREAGKLIALGEQELDRKNNPEARRLFEEALRVAPNDWTAHAYLAEMFMDSKEMDFAYRHLVRMEEVDPDSVIGNYLMARHWFLRQDFVQARDYAERAKALRPANAELRNLLGQIYTRLELKKEARSEHEEAVRLAPNELEYQKNLKALQDSLAR